MASRAVQIIRALYGSELMAPRRSGLFKLLPGRRKPPRRERGEYLLDLYRVRRRLMSRGTILLAAGVVVIVLLFAASVYYFNVLTSNEQDVYMEGAKIHSLLQRRRNISINLARTVYDYALHERGVLDHVSNMRMSSRGSAPSKDAPVSEKQAGKSPPAGKLDNLLALLEGGGAGALDGKSLDKLLAVAESYPDLKLSENFRRFMDALVETEKDLSDARMKYSEMVNTYSTRMKTVPGKWFAAMYGFGEIPYFEADGEARSFRPVDY